MSGDWAWLWLPVLVLAPCGILGVLMAVWP